MEWNGCLSILQGYLENSPLIVLGSGASMPYGLPSMGTLAEEIKSPIALFPIQIIVFSVQLWIV